LTKEEKEEKLKEKITEEIKERKKINDEALEKSKEASAIAAAENEARFRKLHEERKQAIANIEAETALINEKERKAGKAAAEARRAMTDEEWVANLPEHHLQGYLEVNDDVEEHEEADDDDDDDEGDLIGVQDEDMYADEDAEADANNEEDDAEGEDGPEEEDGEEDSAPQSLAQKDQGHLHKTSIRVDPPLTKDGKKSI